MQIQRLKTVSALVIMAQANLAFGLCIKWIVPAAAPIQNLTFFRGLIEIVFGNYSLAHSRVGWHITFGHVLKAVLFASSKCERQDKGSKDGKCSKFHDYLLKGRYSLPIIGCSAPIF